MFQFERGFRIVLLCDEPPEFEGNLNILDAVVQHLLRILGEVFELDLMIGQAPSPGLKRCSATPLRRNLRILFTVQFLQNFFGPDQSGANKRVDNAAFEDK